ncbi:metalloendoproteinase 1-like [Sesamum indicum]|uniref:Metalloendoproteinase 1-like n=1 Tax=Sesamum indicum TaxID=4182 RepID=A0A6I9SRV3_SESIN|nr:metalloendoproteinase 1-like [Sesamum indicum]
MIMEPKFLHLLSCILLLFLLNPLSLFTHANSPNQLNTQRSSGMDFLKTLIGTQKGTTSKGISQLKKYLSHFGYMNHKNNTILTHQTDDFFDDNLELAIKSYQTFFKLKVNGIMDANIVAKMSHPRCGVPDSFNLNRSHKLYLRIPTLASHYTFFPGEPKWPPTKRSLTYSFPLGGPTNVNSSILHATQIWASVTPFRFSYRTNYDQADIKISFQYRDHGDGYPFDGPGGILAHAFAPSDGRLHFDGDERWVDGVTLGAFDMQTVGLHELGHVLGLGHTNDTGAIMYPYIGDGLRKVLGQDDINGIKALYQF